MRYVIIRDDDTCGLTPPEWLERLYAPFLELALPVNLSTIPEVSTNAKMGSGEPEGFLLNKNGTTAATVPLSANRELLEYLHARKGLFHIVQHGLHHDYLEFDREDRAEIARRLERGTEMLQEAGFEKPETFVAPYDRMTRQSLAEVASRFRVVSTGWYELRRLPYVWWPAYALKKARHTPHWRVGNTLMLTHPGCLLSCHRAYSTMLGGILHFVESQQLTVLVTHWWEYFREGKPDDEFISFLHETALYLAGHPELEVITFSELVKRGLRVN